MGAGLEQGGWQGTQGQKYWRGAPAPAQGRAAKQGASRAARRAPFPTTAGWRMLAEHRAEGTGAAGNEAAPWEQWGSAGTERAERRGWAGTCRALRERRGGCIGFNRAKTSCKPVVQQSGLASAGVKQEWGNPAAVACCGLAMLCVGLSARPSPTLLHLPIPSSVLKPQARGWHSTQQGCRLH
ncbi:hypothetical protein CIB84_016613 [Bambusicola thoracicus]|uniref:Uncharacterized protein n=1 Tax=Bambusicola thoracicus TaxID=9083 RepID=A0A2P4S696_BAMTH|nr:hypothetical protein CIB84_016613 [Bambusicola thoracicus]